MSHIVPITYFLVATSLISLSRGVVHVHTVLSLCVVQACLATDRLKVIAVCNNIAGAILLVYIATLALCPNEYRGIGYSKFIPMVYAGLFQLASCVLSQ